MNARAFRALLADGPQAALLEAVDNGQDRTRLVPLLEAELQRSSARLQRLKEYRNELTSPMYCLQPEILSRIFCIYALDNNELFNLRWTRLLFVCRRWHDIAMNTLKLWSFIDIGPAEATYYGDQHKKYELDARDVKRVELQRTRAARAPLTIRMGLFALLSEAKLAYASMYWQPDSLRSLSVNGEAFYIYKIVRGLAASRHAVLTTLELNWHGDNHQVPVGLESDLNVVMKDGVPKLQHLSITGLPFNWAHVHSLRTLHIAYHSLPTSSLALQDIVEALSRCPRLEFLAIRLPASYHPDVAISSAVVSLRSITAIVVQATTKVCIHVLQALFHSSSTKLIVSTTDAAQDLPLAANMGGHITSESAPTLRSLVFSFTLQVPPMMDEDGMDNFNPGPPVARLGVVGQASPKRLFRGAINRWFHDWQEPEELPIICIDTLASDATQTTQTQTLQRALQSWPLSSVTHLDMRLVEFGIVHLDMVIAEVPEATTVIVRPESLTAHTLLAILQSQLRNLGRRVFEHIIFDATEVTHHTLALHPEWGTAGPTRTEVRARRNVLRTLVYCEEAARMGVPLGTIEIINEPYEARYRLIGHTEEVDWSELYDHLQLGFVYEKVMHSADSDLDGKEWDPYVDN